MNSLRHGIDICAIDPGRSTPPARARAGPACRRSAFSAAVRRVGRVCLLLASAGTAWGAPPAPSSIRVVIDDNYPPYIFRGADGRIQGIRKDLWDLWQRRTGIKVELQAMDWSKVLAEMQKGQADVIDTIFETPARRERYDFSAAYATIDVPIFFDRHISGITGAASLEGFTVGVKDGDACIDYLNAHGIKQLRRFPSYAAEVRAAVHHDIRLLCIDLPPAAYLFERAGATGAFRYTAPLYTGEFHWAVAKGRTGLKALIAGGFARISPDERKAIETRWLGRTLERGLGSRLILYATYAIFAVLLGGAGLLAWNRSLRRRVAARTSALSATFDTLRQSETRRRAILDTAMDGFWLADRDGRLLEVNQTYCRMTGYSEAELLAMRMSDMHAAGTVHEVQERLRETRARGENRFESHHRRKDGSYFDVEVSIQYRPDEGGRYVAFLRDITDRKRAEDALRRSEERFRRFFYLSPDAVVVNRYHDGTYVSVNRGFTLMSGYTAEEAVGRSRRELDVWADHADVERLAAALKRDGAVANFEARLRAKDGSVRQGLISATIMDVEGVPHLLSVTRDITERKATEDALVETQARLTRAQRVAHMGFFERNLSTGEVVLSGEIHKLYGIAPDRTVTGSYIVDHLVHPDDRERVRTNLDLAVRGIAAFDIDYRIRRPDGSVIWVHGQAERLAGADGAPGYILGAVIDITERKNAELRMSLERTVSACIAESTDEGSTIEEVLRAFCDAEGWDLGAFWQADEAGAALRLRAVYCRPGSGLERAARRFGDLAFAPDAWIASRVWRSVRPRWVGDSESDSQLAPDERALMRESGLRRVFALPVVASTRTIGAWALFGREPQDADASVVAAAEVIGGRLGQFLERRRAESLHAALEAQLRESQKMQAIGTLAGGIAHDFNNIIAAILGNANLARQDLAPDSPALESVEEIRKAGARARALVSQILSFSRRQPTERRLIELAPVVEEARRLLRATLPARLTLDVECAPDIPPVLADAIQIEQVLVNLATNAMQAMPSGKGRIRFRLDAVELNDALARTHPALTAMHARSAGRAVRLEVSDSGPGIEAAVLDRIFEPFFSTKTVGEGTGLGLSVVHGIVQMHGGAITVRSRPGDGTTFTIFLPVASPADVAPRPEAPNAGVLAGGNGQHVLYIDDDEALVRLMKRLLERNGYRVSAFTSQRAALDAFRSRPGDFDLIVADYNMPGMSGLDVARKVREIRADVPIVVASGYIDNALREEAPAAGVRELVFKADSAEELCDAVARIARSLGDSGRPPGRGDRRAPRRPARAGPDRR